MKKTLFTLILTAVTIFASAQCTPDPQYVNAGIYPDTITGLADGSVGQAYNELITIITPTDTDVVYLGQTINVTIDSINLTDVTGLPPNFSYDCDPPTCSFPGGSITCADLYSTSNPTAADVGLYPITFGTTTYVSNVPLIGTTTQNDITDGYYLEILNTTSVINQYYNNTFELKGAFPNPSNYKTEIQFIVGNKADITFTIYNLLGEKVDMRVISANRGINSIDVNTTVFPEGMYMYSINNGKRVLTKSMIVAN